MKITSAYSPTNVYYSNRKQEGNFVDTNGRNNFSNYLATIAKDDNNIITDNELYSQLIEKHGRDINSIARELVAHKAVNPKNINPRNCTRLEMEILYESINEGKERCVKTSAHINFAMRYQIGNGELKKISEFAPDDKFDWIKKIQAFSRMQINLGNMDFINNGTLDSVNSYIDELLSFGRS